MVKVTIDLSEEMHSKLKKNASDNHRSIKSQLLFILVQNLKLSDKSRFLNEEIQQNKIIWRFITFSSSLLDFKSVFIGSCCEVNT